ncbi:hypothetical protein [Streptomyces echinatus]|uniref:NADH-quinone oxidoreductase subunit D-related protein n=1 Tax=Streptomyces echinatus TaxID=67293 RepID=UPI003CD0BFA8
MDQIRESEEDEEDPPEYDKLATGTPSSGRHAGRRLPRPGGLHGPRRHRPRSCASAGLPHDLRKYSRAVLRLYERIDSDVPTADTATPTAVFLVRLEEMRQSLRDRRAVPGAGSTRLVMVADRRSPRPASSPWDRTTRQLRSTHHERIMAPHGADAHHFKSWSLRGPIACRRDSVRGVESPRRTLRVHEAVRVSDGAKPAPTVRPLPRPSHTTNLQAMAAMMRVAA